MASITTIKATHPPSLYKMPQLLTIDAERSGGINRKDHENPIPNPLVVRPRTSSGPFASRPLQPEAHAPPKKAQDGQMPDSLRILKRPQKQSSPSTYRITPPDSFPPRTRSASWGSIDNVAARGSSASSPSSTLRQRIATPTGKARPSDRSVALPGEVVELVLRWLKRLHLEAGSDSCATCWMRDLCSISLCSREWLKYARAALYEDIRLVGSDSATHKKKFKQVQGSRLVLLRRTLRANSDIARLVRSLKVPKPEPALNWTPSKGFAWLEQYEDRVASLVQACPNLEKLSNPTWVYDHSFKRIYHALSTRKALKEMVWILDAPASASQSQQQQQQQQSQQQQRPASSSRKALLVNETPPILSPLQEDAFLDLHRNWSSLRELSVYCRPGTSLAPHTLLSRTLTCLPSLQHLRLCNLPSDTFNDENLLSLPRLKTLVLSHISGITSGGLSSFATLPNSFHLQRLDLRHTPLTSLPALARIFSNLTNLVSFSLAQTFQPVMPESDSFTLWMMPYLASPSIAKLHWDITSQVGHDTADDILVRSIEAGGFPALTLLRAPNDPEGRFQALCRPVEQISLPGDRFGNTGGIQPSNSFSVPASPISPLTGPGPLSPIIHPIHKSLTIMSLPSQPTFHLPLLATDLSLARLAAQSRLEAAQDRNPRIKINIIAPGDDDDDGGNVRVAQSFGMAHFIGTLGSRIRYHLLPDEGAADEHGGLLDVGDLVADGGESLGGNRQGCIGSWNYREGVVADRREKEKWWHTERGRWTESHI